MRLNIPLEGLSETWTKFNTQEEWDNHVKFLKEHHETYWHSPHKFPCYALNIGTIPISNGADEVAFCFLYDFEEIKEEGDE